MENQINNSLNNHLKQPLPGKLLPDKPLPGKLLPDKPLPGKLLPDKPLPGKLLPSKALPGKFPLKRLLLKKLLLTAVILGTGLLLTAGLFSETVELRSKQPLIDLDLYVKDSEPGQGGNPESGLEGAAQEEPESRTEPETEAEPETVPQAEEAKRSAEILVEIRDTAVSVNGNRCTDLKDMLRKVKDCYRVGLKVVLRDSYAEYRTYREVYEALRGQHYTVTEEAAE